MSEEDIIQSKKITTTQGIQGSEVKNLPLEGSPEVKVPVAHTLPPPVLRKRRRPAGRNPKKKHKGPDFLPGFDGDQISLKGIQNSVLKNLPHEGSAEVIGEEASGLPPRVCRKMKTPMLDTRFVRFSRIPVRAWKDADRDIFPALSNDIWILKPVRDQMSLKGEEKIAKEKAICTHCCVQLVEGEEVLKSVCGCSNPLVHVTCADSGTRKEGNICNNCEKEVHNEAVTLHKVMNITQGAKKAKKNKNCCFGSF